jgi:hypothetical protein
MSILDGRFNVETPTKVPVFHHSETAVKITRGGISTAAAQPV